MPAAATTPRQCLDGLYMFFAGADAFWSLLKSIGFSNGRGKNELEREEKFQQLAPKNQKKGELLKNVFSDAEHVRDASSHLDIHGSHLVCKHKAN